MIGFYIYSSHLLAESVLRTHLWEDGGIESRLVGKLDWRKYGTELREILIGVYAEGKIAIDAPVGPRVGRVSKKDKSLRIDVSVEPDLLISLGFSEARNYLVRLIASALRLPADRRKWDFDFPHLASDFENIQNGER